MPLVGSLSKPSSLIGSLSSPRKISGNVSKVPGFSGKLSNVTLRGYSAYDLAVLAGFEGTEEEWLMSLRAERIDMRNNDGVLEYKYENDDTWIELIDLRVTMGDYENLLNRPSIDGTLLSGDRNLSEDYMRNDRALTNMEIENLLT